MRRDGCKDFRCRLMDLRLDAVDEWVSLDIERFVLWESEFALHRKED